MSEKRIKAPKWFIDLAKDGDDFVESVMQTVLKRSAHWWINATEEGQLDAFQELNPYQKEMVVSSMEAATEMQAYAWAKFRFEMYQKGETDLAYADSLRYDRDNEEIVVLPQGVAKVVEKVVEKFKSLVKKSDEKNRSKGS